MWEIKSTHEGLDHTPFFDGYYLVKDGERFKDSRGLIRYFTSYVDATVLALKLNQGETMSDYPFYDPTSMLAKRNKLKAKLREEQKRMNPWDQLMEECSFSKKAVEPEFKARPAVEKTAPKLLKEKITNDLNTVLALALEGLDNMNKDGVDDVYNVSKIRDLIVKVNREVAQE